MLISQTGRLFIDIPRFESPTDLMATVAQYQVRSVPELKAKLAQYPRGTTLTLRINVGDARLRAAGAELADWAAGQGIVILD